MLAHQLVDHCCVSWCMLLLILGTWSLSATGIRSEVGDTTLHRYTETGEVAQLIYATRAVQRSTSPLVAFSDYQGRWGMLIRQIRPKSNSQLLLRDAKSISLSVPIKSSPLSLQRNLIMLKTENNIAFTTVGLPADCTYLERQISLITQNHKLTFGEEPSVEHLSAQIGQWVARGLYR